MNDDNENEMRKYFELFSLCLIYKSCKYVCLRWLYARTCKIIRKFTI